MEDYTKPTKRDFNPDLYILHVRKNDLSLDGTPEVMSSRIIDTTKSLITEKTKQPFQTLRQEEINIKRKGKY